MAQLKKVFCKTCGKGFFRINGRVNEAEKFGWNQYCSKECLSRERNKRQTLLCENCGGAFQRPPHEILTHNYCCQSCAAVVNNKKYPKRHQSPELRTCVNCSGYFRKSTGNSKYCSIRCVREAKFYTPEKLLVVIKNEAQKIGRTPARREMGGISSACQRFFGSWNKAMIAAGLFINRSDSQRMYKRTNTKALDGHLCDSVSEALIDNWLFSHKIFHQRDVIYPTTNHKADWAVDVNGQRIFIEYFGLASDSPRYDRDVSHKKELCEANGIPLIEIYPQDLYPQRRLMAKLGDLETSMSGRPDVRRS
ncbi:MAG: hypothetical protein NTZ42_03015 [Candidatus Gribaldobacteria bacterium]|nr:hypothetical protein [Candidatus Gribaldobacteria bacterium]